MEWWGYAILFIAAFLAGVINSIAGSGSLLTLPALMLLGVPAPVANGTNRLAMLSQAIASVLNYRRHGIKDFGTGYWLVLPPSLGAAVGAYLALDIGEGLLRWILLGVMVVMVVLLFVDVKRWFTPVGSVPQGFARNPWVWVVLFLVGCYAGFVQVGSNYFVLFILVLWGHMDVHHANSLKLLVQCCFTVVALPFFISGGLVNWSIGLLMALGSGLGAWLGSFLALRLGMGFVRWVIVAAVLAFAVRQGWTLLQGV